jgi:hypothetical protein
LAHDPLTGVAEAARMPLAYALASHEAIFAAARLLLDRCGAHLRAVKGP